MFIGARPFAAMEIGTQGDNEKTSEGKLRISYDSKYDLLYLKFTEGTPQVTTENLTEDGAFDYDEKGKVVGIEFLSASKYFDLAGLLPVSVERN